MDLTLPLTLSLIVFAVGLFYRLAAWFGQGLPPVDSSLTVGRRLLAALRTIPATLFSSRLLRALRSLLVDALLQKRILDQGISRWLAHTLIVVGFLCLLLFHALDGQITESLFPDYQSTLNPYLFLRNLFGVLVLAGIGLAVVRRIRLRTRRLRSNSSDWAALAFLAAIILSGMVLEGSRIRSYSVYQEMVEEYAAFANDEDELALEAFWVAENGLSSANFPQLPAADQVTRGQEVNEGTCTECHVSNRYAFASMALAGVATPARAILGDSGAVNFFWYLHILLCFAFLAWLPFAKMFHVIAAPLNLLIRGAGGENPSLEPANLLNRQMIGLSACTHCGACSVACSSSMFFASFQNEFILPSEKVQYLQKFAAGKEKDPAVWKRMQQGLYVCTSCDRCTTICPSGINLREIFVNSRYQLLADGPPESALLSHFSFPLALAQVRIGDHLQALKKVTELFRQRFQRLADLSGPIQLDGAESTGIANHSYLGCYSCARCSNICPVVRSYEHPVEALGMLPHQIIFSLGIGKTELAMGAKMLWSCSTCYLCQENCPNQVELCDIFYTLKNSALIEAGAQT